MPEGPAILASLLVAGAVTVALRAVPFVVIEPLRRSSVIRFLGLHLPAGIMVILTIYTLQDVPLRSWPHALPEVVALTVTVALHLWRRSAVLSILAGTATYVVLTSWLVSGGAIG
ncbi:MAG: AzlD domain-containing protein [Acidimicrobiales bacterium]|nr:AzlD domain-containing protein [Acidimicrobiales bacterium]HRW38794.1 AzlD domain-containing protein [Aquihabitans sp.]